MATFRPLDQKGDFRKDFATEDGTHYRVFTQDTDKALRHVEKMRRGQRLSRDNPNGWGHAGSIPIAILRNWLTKHGYTIDQWARNDGGAPNISIRSDFFKDGGVKAKFLRYFVSRDFSKLHNSHITTKAESNRIVVPRSIERQAVDLKL